MEYKTAELAKALGVTPEYIRITANKVGIKKEKNKHLVFSEDDAQKIADKLGRKLEDKQEQTENKEEEQNKTDLYMQIKILENKIQNQAEIIKILDKQVDYYQQANLALSKAIENQTTPKQLPTAKQNILQRIKTWFLGDGKEEPPAVVN